MSVKLGAIAGATGGMLWAVAAWFAALSPPHGRDGNVGNTFVTEDAWMLAALPLIAVGALTLYRLQRRRVPAVTRIGASMLVVGATLASVSLALEALGTVVMQRPLLEIGSQVLLIPLGGLLLAVGSLRSRVVPPAVAGLLLLGSGLLYIANSENWMAGLAAVFGLGWIAVGARLATQPTARAPVPAGSPVEESSG